MTTFQICWTEPPFRAKQLSDYAQSGPDRASFSGSTVQPFFICLSLSLSFFMAPRWQQRTIAPRALKKNKINCKECLKVNHCF